MFIIIVGGGKVGLYLVRDFTDKGHRVLLIEEDWEKVKEIRKKYGIEVVWGDGSEETVLEEAGIEDCDALVAVTEDDQNNLVICQLAERKYNIAKTYTRVNTPGNEKLFSWLGVNVAVSSATILSAMVEEDITFNNLRNILIKDQDKLKLIRIAVQKNSPSIKKKIKDIKLPTEAVLVAILRGDNSLVPRGNTRIMENDVILALTRPELEEDMLKAFNG
ncbi:MAG TPA: TrkA family potassium uptake protein [Halanaerobiaceae bacterium]|jgi:trk system potassium uptake protein TrkA|nr:TrkA family potassium uptake protein [Bacillota bacterium]HHU91885.1 TrkA family potassium uptake protein [Halanaerobiaceae bacterium]HOA40786.1 TrkA family potassium uptake protein [Halanaerobiales bacterium]HPZ62992.1 TrkA family potassium uptake protein [Halanaerobiales bacterium]HQD04199.1 TrkA family potassium uptake protein [Halanaerobiales bacterium]